MSTLGGLSARTRSAVDARSVSTPALGLLAAVRPLHLRPRLRVPAGQAAPLTRRASVSVIIPCYNYAHFLPGAVRSALDQDDVDVQVVVVDDCSTDGTRRVAHGFADEDPRVVPVDNDVNLGHVRAFNRGLEHATGEFVARLDADDLLTPGSLARACALFDAEPDVGLVYGHPRHFVTSVAPPAQVGAVGSTVWAGRDWLAERCRVGVNCITTPEAVVRASVIEQVGPLDTRLGYAQDMEMWCRVASVSDVGRVDGADQALHRDHAGSMSATDGSGALLDLRERATVFDVVFGGPGGDLPDAQELHATARRTLAREAVDTVHRMLDRPDAQADDVLALVSFAKETDAAVLDERRGRALLRRLDRVGPVSHRDVTSSLVGYWRSALGELDYIRWTYRGI
ncbi:glycosyltransferase family 2 protein [Cellulomonas soli]